MKKKITFLTLVACIFAGQVLADNIYLPTVAYRNNGQQKTVYEYNNDGYVTSGKLYYKLGESDEYTLTQSVVYDYHKLSNGEIVRIKAESDSYRETAAYDSKDMLLWKQSESFDESTWVLESREEAVVNGDGIRTGIRKYNPATKQMETVPGYIFDNKGRMTQFTLEGEHGYTYTCTWGSSKLYTGYSTVQGTTSMVYQNLNAVLNEQYFNPYELFAGTNESSSVASAVPFVLLQPSYIDYEMHHVFYSGEAIYMGITFTQQIVQDNANNEISEIIKMGNTEFQKTVYKQLANGGWLKTMYENGVITGQATKEYDSHGVMTRNYYVEEDGNITNETIYAIEYDTQGRPAKATKTYINSNNEPSIEEESYDEWVVKNTSNIEQTLAPILSVYPNPATDYIVIDNIAEGSIIQVNDLSGRTVHKQTAAANRETVSVESLAKGVYLVSVQTGNHKTIGKIIKK